MNHTSRYRINPLLILYDTLILAVVCFGLLFIYSGERQLTAFQAASFFGLAEVCVIVSRIVFGIYRQIWRYGGIWCYVMLFISDGAAFLVFYVLEISLPVQKIFLTRIFSLFSMNLLLALAMRIFYRYAFMEGSNASFKGRLFLRLLKVFRGKRIDVDLSVDIPKKRIAIVGAGKTGTTLAEELLGKPDSPYFPNVFIDKDKAKIGKQICGIPVIAEDDFNYAYVKNFGVEEIVFALPNASDEKRKALYDKFTAFGVKIKTYEYPIAQIPGDGKRIVRDINIEELLLRKPVFVINSETEEHYRGKTVLITGGGGSIGSELCRQIAKMKPKTIVLVDIYENGAYDVQQELRIIYKKEVDIRVEIVSITNREALKRVFARYTPQIVLNAAAHKHVPLMENNCIEAIENNVFGTLNVVELSEEYGAERFIMISTDKAVNPTNVMGATKRMCEMIVSTHSTKGFKTVFSATRFGNVLGSAGSVVRLFKKQIANGGPVTVTDKRIIRYFMTIPEATQLVLQSGSIAQNGELFVLDMGNPVKILELAENMITLSGMRLYVDIDIVETGLRAGEKLYEELLIKSDDLQKTENNLIFIEKDEPISEAELENKLSVLREAMATGDDELAREALMRVVPTYKKPEEMNAEAENTKEMRNAL